LVAVGRMWRVVTSGTGLLGHRKGLASGYCPVLSQITCAQFRSAYIRREAEIIGVIQVEFSAKVSTTSDQLYIPNIDNGLLRTIEPRRYNRKMNNVKDENLPRQGLSRSGMSDVTWQDVSRSGGDFVAERRYWGIGTGGLTHNNCFNYYRAHGTMSQKRLYYYLLKMVIERDHIWQLLMHQYISDRSNQSIDVDLCV